MQKIKVGLGAGGSTLHSIQEGQMVTGDGDVEMDNELNLPQDGLGIATRPCILFDEDETS